MTGAAHEAFLLTRQWRDGPDGVELVFWATGEEGPLRIRVDRQEVVCFAPRGRVAPGSHPGSVRELELRGLDGPAVDGIYFSSRRELQAARGPLVASGIPLYETDVKPSDRYLMERFITAGLKVTATGEPLHHHGHLELRNPRLEPSEFRPRLKVVSLDIETGGFEDVLYSISVTGEYGGRIFLLRDPRWQDHSFGERLEDSEPGLELTVHHDEETLLEAFFSWIAHRDPDVIIGWNVIDFDLSFLERRCNRLNLAFALGRGRDRAVLLSPSGPGQKRVALIPGRVVLDGIDTMRNATWSFEDFSLESVAQELLGRGKRIQETDDGDRIGEIRRLYHEVPEELVHYNLEDCRLVEEIFAAAKLIDFVLERSRLTGLAMDRAGGSVAAFDNLYLPRLHRRGFVAPDVHRQEEAQVSPGGYVMDSRPGLFENVVVLDFKSLYPSIILTFRVDPLGLRVGASEPVENRLPGFKGAVFSKKEHILPGLIAELWKARDEAKRKGDEALSRAIKIIMNSFYGVLGTTGCRFFEPRLASSITMRGQEILSRTREWIEEQGYPVIYGDTDSVFVLLSPDLDEVGCRRIGSQLAAGLNERWSDHLDETYGVSSHLELEFERHYLRFFMPTVRHSAEGSKKRYAGLVMKDGTPALNFTGLEAVRSDWTRLAREFQRELTRRIFADEPFEDYVKAVAADLFAGRRDGDLVYRKRLRRRLADYRKNVPPHAQAARKSKRPGRWVRYVMTVEGPEPLDDNPSPLDYQHYLDRQLAPAADVLLQLKGTSVEKILDRQLSLF